MESIQGKLASLWVNASAIYSLVYFTLRRLKLSKLERVSKPQEDPDTNVVGQTASDYHHLFQEYSHNQNRLPTPNFELEYHTKLDATDTTGKNNAESVGHIAEISRLCNFPRCVYFYNIMVFVMYTFFLLKNICIFIVNMTPLKEDDRINWLDCYLVGRLSLTSKMIETSYYASVGINMYQLINKTILISLGDRVRLYCFEFLVFKYDQVAMTEIQFKKQILTNTLKSSRPKQPSEFESILCFENPYKPGQIISRPNRSTFTWKFMTWGTITFGTVCYGVYLCICLMLFILFSPFAMTKRGFELNYSTCIQTISNKNDRQMYDNIYRFEPNFKLQDIALQPNESPIPEWHNLQVYSLYHKLRAFADMAENIIINSDIILTSSFRVYNVLVIVLDVFIYATSIKKKLIKLVNELQIQNLLVESINETTYDTQTGANSMATNDEHHKGSHYSLPPLRLRLNSQESHQAIKDYYRSASNPNDSRWFSKQIQLQTQLEQNQSLLRDEIRYIQALILDYFKMLNNYNLFVGVLILFDIAIWIIYSVCLSVRFNISTKYIAENSSYNNQDEFIVLFLLSGLVIIIILGCAAILRHYSLCLYPLITRAMALDTNVEETKLRWSTMIRHFYPRSLYCFRLFQSIELSTLFGLQLFTWVSSALFVMRSFH